MPFPSQHDAIGQRATLHAILQLLETAQRRETYVKQPFVWPQTARAGTERGEDVHPPVVRLLQAKPGRQPIFMPDAFRRMPPP